MNERRRLQLFQEGIDPDKVEKTATRFFEIMKEEGFSLKGADATSKILSNMVENAHLRNPNEKLKNIDAALYALHVEDEMGRKRDCEKEQT